MEGFNGTHGLKNASKTWFGFGGFLQHGTLGACFGALAVCLATCLQCTVSVKVLESCGSNLNDLATVRTLKCT